MTKAQRGVSGPSIQVDPLFPYYENRTPDSIAEEIEAAGYAIVHYFVVSESRVNGELIRAFQRRGMFVWALVLGNGTFSTAGYPDDWPRWQMELLKPCDDGYTRFSYFSEAYVSWKQSAISEMLVRYPFDGIEIAEPYFPEWDGIRRGVYGDVGPLARAAFRKQYGHEIPDFVNRRSPNYYKTNQAAYKAWIHFRVEAVNGFLDQIVNGAGGARTVRPDIAVATWSLAVDAGSDSVERLKEMQGLDAPSMIKAVKPDMHMLQTHWPDWTKAGLSSDYVRSYEPFARPIRLEHPGLPLAVQADIGSARHMIKGREWLSGFHQTAFRLGYSSWTAYEYHICGAMYDTPPIPFSGIRLSDTLIRLSFNKRIDAESCLSLQQRFGLYAGGMYEKLHVDRVQVDGNRLYLHCSRLPSGPLEVAIPGILDTPALWLYRDFKPNAVAPGTRIAVADWGK
ncbi:N-acyl-D-glucosamine 2-epimerase [Paenibacillus ginsengarvi]|uniref:N-acyl-D-glucosamine 2-epimerase n=1 Tax=Paenibacillus ginsengarvi TaxID=400777 RepID=A0A3B0CJT8_9BACL|nr:N-acyl-D-glucosamine 2-epimerase [Paenibacillus ginsengarvi]RKN84266.1 N-acyl-D-glucosamine 2-epimerase [Paenibacillus ginsengarvi]